MSALALLLQACATYQAPIHGAIRPAEYYANNNEYQDAWDEYAPEVVVGMADSTLYPWWSVDYYYLGPHHYRPAYWGGPRFSLGYRYGYPPNYWVYYGFYSPFYYPYSTWAWYDPWHGWPRYGIGTNFFWHNIYWATRDASRSGSRAYRPVNRNYGISRYDNPSVFGDPLNNARDRAGSGPPSPGSLATTPGTRTGSMQVRSRSDRKIRESRAGTTATIGSPRVGQQSSRTRSRAVAAPPRPSSAPQPPRNTRIQDSQPVRKREN